MGAINTTRGDDDTEGSDDSETEAGSATTARPPIAPSVLARRLDAATHPSTQPPEPAYDILRDSCRVMRAADVALAAIDVEWSADEDDELDPKKTEKTDKT